MKSATVVRTATPPTFPEQVSLQRRPPPSLVPPSLTTHCPEHPPSNLLSLRPHASSTPLGSRRILTSGPSIPLTLVQQFLLFPPLSSSRPNVRYALSNGYTSYTPILKQRAARTLFADPMGILPPIVLRFRGYISSLSLPPQANFPPRYLPSILAIGVAPDTSLTRPLPAQLQPLPLLHVVLFMMDLILVLPVTSRLIRLGRQLDLFPLLEAITVVATNSLLPTVTRAPQLQKSPLLSPRFISELLLGEMQQRLSTLFITLLVTPSLPLRKFGTVDTLREYILPMLLTTRLVIIRVLSRLLGKMIPGSRLSQVGSSLVVWEMSPFIHSPRVVFGCSMPNPDRARALLTTRIPDPRSFPLPVSTIAPVRSPPRSLLLPSWRCSNPASASELTIRLLGTQFRKCPTDKLATDSDIKLTLDTLLLTPMNRHPKRTIGLIVP